MRRPRIRKVRGRIEGLAPADTLAELRSALAGLETRPTQALIKLLLLMQLPNLTEGFQKA
jgi:hypothetical protein